MHSPIRPVTCVILTAILVAALLPLPGAWTVILLTPLVIVALAPSLRIVGIHHDQAIGHVQQVALGAAAGPRAPPAHLLHR
jgi:hypothetical protein